MKETHDEIRFSGMQFEVVVRSNTHYVYRGGHASRHAQLHNIFECTAYNSTRPQVMI